MATFNGSFMGSTMTLTIPDEVTYKRVTQFNVRSVTVFPGDPVPPERRGFIRSRWVSTTGSAQTMSGGYAITNWPPASTTVTVQAGNDAPLSHLIIQGRPPLPPGRQPLESDWETVATWWPPGTPGVEPGGGSPGGVAKKALPGSVTVAPGVPEGAVTPGGAGDGSPLDIARDAANRAGADVATYTGTEWVVEPAIPEPGPPSLVVAVGSNLTGARHIIDLDTSGHATGVILRYTPPGLVGVRTVGTVAEDGHSVIDNTVSVRATIPGTEVTGVMVEERTGVPVTHEVAAETATLMARRAWLRGHTMEVRCPAAWWVRPRNTVHVRVVPGGEVRPYWVATVRVSSTDAQMTLGLRPFTLGMYPAM